MAYGDWALRNTARRAATEGNRADGPLVAMEPAPVSCVSASSRMRVCSSAFTRASQRPSGLYARTEPVVESNASRTRHRTTAGGEPSSPTYAEAVIVGSYVDAAGNDHGFLYSNGTYTTFDFPGAAVDRSLGDQRAGRDRGGLLGRGLPRHTRARAGLPHPAIQRPRYHLHGRLCRAKPDVGRPLLRGSHQRAKWALSPHRLGHHPPAAVD